MSEAKLNVAMYLWKKEMDIINYAKKDQANLLRAYGGTIGQCTEAICAKLEVKDRYDNITSSGDVIGILKLIKTNPTATKVTSTSLKLCTRPSVSSTPHIKRSPPHAQNTLRSSRQWWMLSNLLEDTLATILSWQPKR